MRFTTRKQRQAPAVIIISLIDILIVLLIFLMVTTTFKQFPAVKLTLPEAKQPKQGVADQEPMIVTVATNEPHYYLNTRPITLSKLQEEFIRRVAANSNATVTIRSDTHAAFGDFLKVVEAANAAKIRSSVSVLVQPAGK
ncbi:MAG: ExbD/TolR family protein [Verrucomicrobiota bacterium]|jgi:biopolymer transport protein ExbD